MNPETSMAEHEAEQIARAKESGRTPVVFVHGLWLLPSSWDRWTDFFEEDDFVALTPGWPDDPLTVEEANAHPEVFAGKSIGDVAAHYESIITQCSAIPQTATRPSRSPSSSSATRSPTPLTRTKPRPVAGVIRSTIAWTVHGDEFSSRDRSMTAKPCKWKESPLSSLMVDLVTIIVGHSGPAA